MACGMLSSIGDFLKMGSDEIIKNMYDDSDDLDEEDSSSRYICFLRKMKFALAEFNINFRYILGKYCSKLSETINLCLWRREKELLKLSPLQRYYARTWRCRQSSLSEDVPEICFTSYKRPNMSKSWLPTVIFISSFLAAFPNTRKVFCSCLTCIVARPQEP